MPGRVRAGSLHRRGQQHRCAPRRPDDRPASVPQAGPVVLGVFFEQQMYASLGYWVALLQVVGLTATLVAYKASHRRLPAAARDT